MTAASWLRHCDLNDLW